MERNGKVKVDKNKIAEEKKSMPIFVKYGLVALSIIVILVGGLFIFFNAAEGYVAKVGNEIISVKEYKFYLTVQKQSMLASAMSIDQNLNEETFWNTKIGGETAIDIARKRALEGITDVKIQLSKAKENKISLTSEEIKNIDSSIKTNYIENEQYGAGNRIKANKFFMDNYGFGIDELRNAQIENSIVQKFQAEEVGKLQIKDSDIKGYYDKHPDWFKENSEMRTDAEEAVWARHILIKAGKDAAQDVKDAAKKKAQDLLDKLKGGADFATLAKENSEDGNAQYGGDYLFGKGRMVLEFENAVFSLNPGQLYDTLVQTDYGYHIIKLDEKYSKDQPVSLKCAAEYREFGSGFISFKLYKEKKLEWEKDPKYAVQRNTAVYNSIK